MRLRIFIIISLAWLNLSQATPADQTPRRWAVADDGGIAWSPKPGETHQDNIEMSGRQVSVIVSYGLDKAGHLSVSRQLVWPMLRFQPNKTRDHLSLIFGEDAEPRVFINQAAAGNATVTQVSLKGLVRLEGTYGRGKEIAFTRTIFPSVDKPLVCDQTTFTNRSAKDVVIEIEANERSVHTDATRGIYGDYYASSAVVGVGARTLKPGESTTASIVFSARKSAEPTLPFDVEAEKAARQSRVESVLTEMILETPDPVLNTAFAFAKIRASESIFATKGGLLHAPGGGAYYAAIWANDQGEYAGPFFAMLGDATARESAINAYRHFARYMNPDYNPIPSSIISEGAATWHGAGDRGDMAMIAYGAGRFALAYAQKESAEELWPLIEWCLEYCRRKITTDGVVASDSDELENRFPAGKANLCTSSLYYDALESAALLGRQLGKSAAQLDDYNRRSVAVRAAIEKYFGAKVEGFETYRYFDKRDLVGHPRHAVYATKDDRQRYTDPCA